MSSRREVAERLLREGRHFEAVERYVQDPAQSRADYRCFLRVLQSSLDHVLDFSPTHFPRLAELVFSKYGSNETVLLLLGTKCLEANMHTEADFFLQRVLTDINSDSLTAKESLRVLRERVVPRWHFLMLNDVTRNSSYSHAISSAVGRIPNCSVLDIGSGTGLLGLLAVRSGASRVYACELNATMVAMSRDILSANGMMDSVTVIPKISTQAAVPTDLPERVSLVVTETVDAGLLGEGIVPILRHAWEELLLPKQPPGDTNRVARCGHVIPCGATVYVMAIECRQIARQSRLLSEAVGGLSFHGIMLEGSCKSEQDSYWTTAEQEMNCENKREEEERKEERKKSADRLTSEPYTCERLSYTRGGYKDLTGSCTALQFDFTDPQIPLPSANLRIPVVMSGCLDAIATYFDLHLDPTTSMSTYPRGIEHCAWEQAVFPVAVGSVGGNKGRKGEGKRVEKGDVLLLHASCSDTLLQVNVKGIERGTNYPTETQPLESSTAEHPISGSSVQFVDRAALCRLNDRNYFGVYESAITHALELSRAGDRESESSEGSSELQSGIAGMELDDGTESGHGKVGAGTNQLPSAEGSGMGSEEDGSGSESEEEEDFADCIALDLSHELSVVGLMAAKIGVDFVQVGRCHPVYQSLLETVAKDNGLQQKTSIKWVELGVTSAPQLTWDMVLCDVVCPQGTLRPGVFHELGSIRSHQSHSDTLILPARVTVHSAAISSPALRAQCAVLGSVPTLGLDIARFINKFQVSHYIDLNLRSLSHDRLTEEIQLLSIDFRCLTTKPFILENSVRIPVTKSGSMSGLAYWFTLHFPNGETISTGPQAPEGNHWHQAVFCPSEDVLLDAGQHLSVRALIRESCLDVTIVSIE